MIYEREHKVEVLEERKKNKQLFERLEKLAQTSPTEFQEECLRIQKEHQKIRSLMRLEKQILKEYELNEKIKSS
jgi:hypothetical protein